MVRWRIFFGSLLLAVSACQTGPLQINVTYERLNGIALEDHVLFQHNVAGNVANLNYTAEGTYTLKLKIAKGFTNAVTEYAQFYIIDDPNRDGRKAVEIRLTQTGGKVLADGATVQGVNPPEEIAERVLRNLEAGFGFVQAQIEKFSRDVQKMPDGDAYKSLKQSIEALADEIRRTEKEARERVKDQWLPLIERQLDALREKLRQLGRENELQPIDERVEKIRRI